MNGAAPIPGRCFTDTAAFIKCPTSPELLLLPCGWCVSLQRSWLGESRASPGDEEQGGTRARRSAGMAGVRTRGARETMDLGSLGTAGETPRREMRRGGRRNAGEGPRAGTGSRPHWGTRPRPRVTTPPPGSAPMRRRWRRCGPAPSLFRFPGFTADSSHRRAGTGPTGSKKFSGSSSRAQGACATRLRAGPRTEHGAGLGGRGESAGPERVAATPGTE